MTFHFSSRFNSYYVFLSVLIFTGLLSGCSDYTGKKLPIQSQDRIVLLGNNLCSRMQEFGHFETELQLRFPDNELFIRNLCDAGNTPGYRPRSGRKSPWAFEGAAAFQPDGARFFSRGHLASPDEWISQQQPDKIIAFFGGVRAFEGAEGLENFREELNAFVVHTLSQKYNGTSAPDLVLVSPIAFEDLNSDDPNYPDGKKENQQLELYSNAIREVAKRHSLLYVDLFNPTLDWYNNTDLTTDGLQLNETGYNKLAKHLTDNIFESPTSPIDETKRNAVLAAVKDKIWLWQQDFKMPNGVHAYGTRYEPYGPENYPDEYRKIREMTAVRDQAIWKALQGEKMDVIAADQVTYELPSVESNYDNGGQPVTYKYDDEAIRSLKVPDGYKVELFASEKDFPELANPAQLSFDNQGRLWVATLESYPHYKPGAKRPNDKLVILEDTDQDGKADKSTVWADGLSLPIGFEFAPEGVYVSQAPDLVLLSDTDGDDKADTRQIILSGFDDHDTHHAISAFCADPSGAIYMGEGLFLQTNVETPYGPQRSHWGGFFRYDPQHKKLERTSSIEIPNPWGIAFNDWGSPFFAQTSNTKVHWMTPSTMRPRFGDENPLTESIIEDKARVRPTSGLEFISSSHFPEEVQGDLLLCNSIGFLGIKQHRMLDDEVGYSSRFRQDLLVGSDPNFRPVDLEFAPDGSLYVIDWHNILIGHMQHNARDPLRDHVHGRVFRITYPERPLVKPAQIAGADLPTLFSNLELPEYRTRYRTRREIRGRETSQVQKVLASWVASLDKTDKQYARHLTEALFVSWGIGQVDREIMVQLLADTDYRARAAAVRVLRYTHAYVTDAQALFLQAAADPHPQVRTEAMVAASWLNVEKGDEILDQVASKKLPSNMEEWLQYSRAHLHGDSVVVEDIVLTPYHMEGPAYGSFMRGQEIYKRDGYCGTCHQMDGKGLPSVGYPPLAGTRWANGLPDRLIKLTLNGLYGPIKVLDKEYPGQVPMTPYGGMLNDQEIADVLTFVRNAFDNRSSVILADEVAKIREEIKDKSGYYSPEELLQAHPFEAEEAGKK